MLDNPSVENQDTLKPTELNQDNINPNDVKQESSGQSEQHSIPYATFKKELDKRKDLEAKLNKIADNQKKAKQAQLEKDGMLQEALDMAKKENEELIGYKQKLAEYENRKREQLLNTLPEDKRERAANFDINALQELSDAYTYNKRPSPNVSVSNVVPGRGPVDVDLKKNWFKMDAQSKRENWQKIIDTFKK